MGFKLSANNVKDCVDEKLGITEFAGMAYTSRQHTIKSPYNKRRKLLLVEIEIKLMSLKSFFNDYQHFYVASQRDSNGRYFLYDYPPTYDHNWQWDANPDQFYEETRPYNGVWVADLSKTMLPTNIKQ